MNFSRKRTSDNQSSTYSTCSQHSTTKTSPYFFQRTNNRNTSNELSRISLLSNGHSKLLHNNTHLWHEDDNDDHIYIHDSSYSNRDTVNQSSTDISLSKAVTTTMNLRKKG